MRDKIYKFAETYLMTLEIRKWKPEDAEQFVQLTSEWGYETTLEKTREQLKRIGELDNAKVFVAETDGKVVGRILVAEHITLGSEPFAEVLGLVVSQNFRQKGIGSALIERAKDWSREKGFKVMRLRANTKREVANRFYPKIGFALEKMQNVYEIRL